LSCNKEQRCYAIAGGVGTRQSQGCEFIRFRDVLKNANLVGNGADIALAFVYHNNFAEALALIKKGDGTIN